MRETVRDCEIEYAGSGDPDLPGRLRSLCSGLPDAGLRWTARDGAQELLNRHREVRLTLEQFESDRYIRLNIYAYLLERSELDAELRWCRATNVP